VFQLRLVQIPKARGSVSGMDEKIMYNFWKEKYDNLVSYLKNRFGASWTLSILTEVEEDRKQNEGG